MQDQRESLVGIVWVSRQTAWLGKSRASFAENAFLAYFTFTYFTSLLRSDV